MESRQESINRLQLKEIAENSLAPSLTFFLVSVIVFFYHFNIVVFRTYLQTASVLVMIASGIRLFSTLRLRVNPYNSNAQNLMKLSVCLNSVGWAVVFSLGAYELKAVGLHFSILILILASFGTASLVTLVYDKTLFFIFQVGIIICPVFSLFFLGLKDNTPEVFWFVGLLSFFFLYQIKQYRTYKGQMLKRFEYQLDLETSNEELTKSKKALLDKTLDLVQVSKATALGEMAGGLSHEVNNSLMVILGASQQMERLLNTEKNLTHQYQSRFTKISNAINKITTVIDGLRYFSRQMESGPKEYVSLGDIIERTLNFSHSLLKAHGIELELGQIPKVDIYAHPIQITQVIFTLLKNAFDALESAKTPVDKWVGLDFKVEGFVVQIVVSNGGPKINESIAERLFQPFFTTKDIGEGTGLSLSIGRGIAREHNGDLRYDSFGEVTKFILELPCNITHRA